MTDTPEDVSIDLDAHSPTPSAGGEVRIFLAAEALEEMNRHAAGEMDHEIGGIMVGTVVDGPGPVVIVENVIRGTHMTHTRGSVTFTHESWSEINRTIDTQYADKKIVGWYHSHPGFGIFLSSYDLFIHQNFFAAPWQIAFVTDPKARSCGFFVWQGSQLEQAADYQVFGPPAATPSSPSAPPPTATHAPVIIQAADPPGPAKSFGILAALGFIAVVAALIAALTLTNYQMLVQYRASLLSLHGKVDQLGTDLHALQSPAGKASVRPTEPAAATPAAETGPAAEANAPDGASAKPATPPDVKDSEVKTSVGSTGP